MKNQKIELTLEQILQPLTDEQMESLSKSDLLTLLRGEQNLRKFYSEKLSQAERLNEELKEQKYLIEDKFVRVKCRLFAPKTERTTIPKGKREVKRRGDVTRLPSERHPDARVIEKDIILETLPSCPCCQSTMKDSGLTEDSEYITYIPKDFLIIRQKRRKYRCSTCQSALVTTPSLPRMTSGSYSDELIIDATLSKYCDLIPMERYCAMATRQGFPGLPPQSLITLSHTLADFILPVFDLIKAETLRSNLLQGDETPHRMLEGSEKTNWYLWGFCSPTSCFYEYHDTRSGQVAADILAKSDCHYFVSDAYTGYSKALRLANDERSANGRPLIIEIYCNAHARRNFVECRDSNPDADYFVNKYQEIYYMESRIKEGLDSSIVRASMRPIFMEMKQKAVELKEKHSSHSSFFKSCEYFIKYFAGLVKCTEDPLIPLDNNQSERRLRSPVIGRKTWYGTHSIRGATTAGVHFTLVESCKLNKVNPRQYYEEMLKAIHFNGALLTPSQYKARETKS